MPGQEEVIQDTGLGLEEFVGTTPVTKESGTKEVSPDKEEASDEKLSPDEKKEEKKEEKEVKAGKEDTDKPEEKPDETKDKVDKEEKPSIDWNSKDNPLKEQLTNTRTYANNEHMAKLKLEKEVDKLKKVADGTWDESEEAKGPSPEQIEQNADLQGRIKASLRMAKEKYGDAYVQENIDNADSSYQNIRKENPLVDIRVSNSETPYMEAIKILKEEEFFGKYGREPEKIVESIKKELDSELRATITKEFQGKLKDKESLTNGIGDARSVPIVEDEKGKKSAQTPLGEIFS